MVTLIKNVFLDILKLYKNFLHFNLSKIVIYLVASLYAIIIALPFILILWGFYYYLLSSGNISFLSGNIFLSIIVILMVIIWLLSIFIGFSYNYVLLTKLNSWYIEWKKTKFSANDYFNFKLFIIYFKTMFLNILIVLAPFLVWIILISIFILILWGVDSAKSISESWVLNIFTIGTLIITILTIIVFIYLMYKTLFTVIILASESNVDKFKTPKYYIKKSFKLTSWFKVFLKLIVIIATVFLVSLPISIPLNYTTFSNDKLSNYIEYKINPDSFSKDNFYYIEDLKQEFWNQDINILVEKLNTNKKYRAFLEVINFLFIFGLFEMMILSFYKRELLWNKKSTHSVSPKGREVDVELWNKKEIKKTVKRKTAVKNTSTKNDPVKRGRGRPKKI